MNKITITMRNGQEFYVSGSLEVMQNIRKSILGQTVTRTIGWAENRRIFNDRFIQFGSQLILIAKEIQVILFEIEDITPAINSGSQVMRTRNCPYCYEEGGAWFEARRSMCHFCYGKKITYEFVEWEESRLKFRVEMRDSLEAVMELKLETAMGKWLKKNKEPRKFPK